MKLIYFSFFIIFILYILLKIFVKNKIDNKVKIAILIITAENSRWELEKKLWKKYIDKYDNIDGYFIKCNIIDNFNTIQNSCRESYKPGIYQKSIMSLDKIGDKYDYYIRTNLSSFIIFKNLIKRLKKLKVNKPYFIGGNCSNDNWVSGTSIILNKLARNILVKKGYNKKYFENKKIPDDVMIGKVLKDNNVLCKSKYCNDVLYWWNYKISFDENIKNINKLDYSILRTRNSGNLNLYEKIINKLINKYY